MKEQIFISYRRDGGDITAKLICEALKNKGYTVFYDYDSLHGGYFDQRIFESIKGCNDFVLVLPENSLDRCANENDWVRQEIECALANKKNIIPVMLPGFEFPADLPASIKDVARINGVLFVMAYFEGVINSIAGRLVSKVVKAPSYTPPTSPVATPSAPASSASNSYSGGYKPNTSSTYTGGSKPKAAPASTYQPPRPSSSYPRKSSRSSNLKPLIGGVVAVALACALYFLVIFPNLIYPNQSSDVLYTPELVQTYSGTYSTSSVNGNAIITIASCDDKGNVTGTFEFFIDKIYGKYEISGKITSKKNNGNLTLSVSAGKWLIQPDAYVPLDTMEIKISNDFKTLRCTKYKMSWSQGSDDEYAIQTPEDLKKLISSTDTYQLRNDIDLSGIDWTPIAGFKGTLMGNGYTIRNLNIRSDASDVGLFGILEGSVTNLKVEDATVEVSGRNENVGILCGQLKGTITSVSVSGTVTADKSTNVGGVCGYVSTVGSYTLAGVSNAASVTGLSCVGGCFGKVYDFITNGTNPYTLALSNIQNSGTVTAIEDYAGGVVGYIDAEASGFTGSVSTTIIDCANTGSVSGNYYVAGIVGYATCDSDSIIDSCTNAAEIRAQAYTGCIAGSTGPYVINNCSNEGSSLVASGYYLNEGKKYAYVGGIVGSGTCMENCTNYIDITYEGGGDFVGGIMGYCNLGPAIMGESLISDTAEANFKNLTNNGNITGSSYVGGIIGGTMYYWQNGCTRVTASFERLTNNGDVIAANDYAGGISGYMAGDVGGLGGSLSWCFYDSTNGGTVSGNANVGGLFGGFRNGEVGGPTYASNTVTIDGCASTGTVTGNANCSDTIGFDDIKR